MADQMPKRKAFVCIHSGMGRPIENGLVTRPMNEPRGQMRAQLIFPQPKSASRMGVNMQTNPYSPKGCQKFAIVIHAMVMIQVHFCWFFIQTLGDFVVMRTI